MTTAPRSGDPARGERWQRVTAAALDVLAEHGSRGLTHRRVDEAAGVPPGATSNVFRTRDALVHGAFERLAMDDFAPTPAAPTHPASGVEAAADALAAMLAGWLAPGERSRLVARYELFLLAARSPELAQQIDEMRNRIARGTARILTELGAADPAGCAHDFRRWADGLMLEHVVTGQADVDQDVLRADVLRRLRTYLPR